MMPEMISTNSSLIEAIGYDGILQQLYVKFPPNSKSPNGSLYVYEEFSSDKWIEFSSAESIGRWFGLNIRNKYSYRKIE